MQKVFDPLYIDQSPTPADERHMPEAHSNATTALIDCVQLVKTWINDMVCRVSKPTVQVSPLGR